MMSGKVVLKKKRSLISPPETDSVVVTCATGMERSLRDELEANGFANSVDEGGALRFVGAQADLPRLNRELRTASRVLVPLARFDAESFDEVYHHAHSYPWEKLMTPEHSFMIVATTTSRSRSGETALRDHRYLAMRIKDAIVDRQREHYGGRRSSIEKKNPTLVVNAFARDNDVELSLDSTGDPLHARGYRREAGEAPLRETVAAEMVFAARRVVGNLPILDPFCGSGTIAIEAALMMAERGPGTLGRRFAYQRWPWWSAVAEKEYQIPVEDAFGKRQKPLIVGTDIDPAAIEIARRNAERAGVENLVQFEVADFRASIKKWSDRLGREHTAAGPATAPQTATGASTGTATAPQTATANGAARTTASSTVFGAIVTNPPYGVRLRPEDLSSLYSDLGNVLRRYAGNWLAVVLAADSAPSGEMRLRAESKIPLHNGPIPCRLMEYRVFGGTSKKGSEK